MRTSSIIIKGPPPLMETAWSSDLEDNKFVCPCKIAQSADSICSNFFLLLFSTLLFFDNYEADDAITKLQRLLRKQILHPLHYYYPAPLAECFKTTRIQNGSHIESLNLCPSFSCVADIKLKTARNGLTEINNSGFKCEELANSIQVGGFLDSKYTTTAAEDETIIVYSRFGDKPRVLDLFTIYQRPRSSSHFVSVPIKMAWGVLFSYLWITRKLASFGSGSPTHPTVWFSSQSGNLTSEQPTTY